MNALVIGYGRSGRAAEALLSSRGDHVTVLEADAKEELCGAFDFAVVSPGVPLTHRLIQDLRARGVPLQSELQLGCEELRKRGWKLLGVTGSKGKSSVVKFVADAINLSGGYAVPCGNYGRPVSDVALNESRVGWAVVEVSSFMMETTELPRDAFEAVAILNLQEDHLDRHGSVEVYHALKRKLLECGKTRIENGGWDDAMKARKLLAGSYFDNEVLRSNGCMAIRLVRSAGLDDAAIARAFRAFRPLPHRMNLLATINGVHYIDDSKATSLAALAAGVSMVPHGVFRRRNVRLIAGGLAKGDDPKSVLSILTKRVKKVYIIGTCAETFAAAWKSSVDCEVVGTMEKAVACAKREAVKGETVLLSPGTASYDQFENFEERGEVFANLVKR